MYIYRWILPEKNVNADLVEKGHIKFKPSCRYRWNSQRKCRSRQRSG